MINTKAIVIIPARLHSTRLPRKVLAKLSGRPMIWHVWNQVNSATQIDDIIVATDAEEVRQIVSDFGAQVVMTSPDCQSGTDRIASIVDQLQADLIVNVQADEPLVSPHMLDDLVHAWRSDPTDLITPVFRLKTVEETLDPNLVKVARTASGQALYFSRSPIPFVRDMPQDQWFDRYNFWGHVGVYGYKREVLIKYKELATSQLEQAEQLEQLRFLENRYQIQTFETTYRPIAVDVQSDLDRVRSILAGETHD